MPRTSTATTRHRAQKHRAEMVVALFLDGYLPHEIAQDSDMKLATVKRTLAERGYNPDRFTYDSQIIDEWVALYTGDHDGEHWSIYKIAKTYERSWSTVAVRVAERVGRLRHPSKHKRKKVH